MPGLFRHPPQPQLGRAKGTPRSPYYWAVRNDMPVAYYRLGEPSGAVIDQIVGGTDGATVGAVTRNVAGSLLTDADGAINFPGSLSGIDIPHQTKLNLGDGPFTIELWANLFTTTGTLISKHDSATYQLSVDGAGNVNIVRAGVAVDKIGTRVLATSQWYHLVWARSGGVDHLYINGIEDTLVGAGGTFGDNTQDLHIGYEGPDGEFTAGKIDEVAIYNTALSITQARNHYIAAGYAFTMANAEVASGTGAALVANKTVGVRPPATTGTGASLSPAEKRVSVNPVTATGYTQVGASNDVDPALQDDAFQFDAFQTTDSAGFQPNAFYSDGFYVAIVAGASTKISVNTGRGTGTGAAYGATFTNPVLASAGVASGTGAASGASTRVSPHPGVGSGTGAARAPSASISTRPSVATATGTAQTPRPSVSARPTAASATGAASNITSRISATANRAQGTGAASTPTPSVKPSAGRAAATGAATNATVSTGGGPVLANAGHAAATGASSAVRATVAPTAGRATATGTATSSGKTISVRPSAASGTGVARNATVTTTIYVNANAQAATGTGAASAPRTAVSVRAGVATATGTANGVDVAASVRAIAAAGFGTSLSATALVAKSALAGLATGTGQAFNASIALRVAAGLTTGIGTAYDPDVEVRNPRSGNIPSSISAETIESAMTADVVAGTMVGTGIRSEVS